MLSVEQKTVFNFRAENSRFFVTKNLKKNVFFFFYWKEDNFCSLRIYFLQNTALRFAEDKTVISFADAILFCGAQHHRKT